MRIRIEASAETWTFMSMYQSARDQQFNDAYLPCDVAISVDGASYSFEEAGIRVRGNTSRTHFFENGQFTHDSHFKINLKATFDSSLYDDPMLSAFKHDWTEDPNGRKARKDRSLFSLEKFNLKFLPRNRSNGDACYLREFYALDRFREAGIPASYVQVSEVTVCCGEEERTGTYELIEPIDKDFLKRRFGKDGAKGDLYKCVYNGMGKADLVRDGAIDRETLERIPNGKIGVEDNYRGYVPCYQLKTNDDLGEGADFSKMSSFIAGIWRCIYGGGTYDELTSLMDLEQFLTFSAVAFMLGNFDDQRYDYNNYYIYFTPSDGKAIFIPYDWDWCLGLDCGNDLAHKGPLDSWTLDGQANSNLYQATLFGGDNTQYDQNPCKNLFLSKIAEYKDEVLSEDNFDTMMGQYAFSSETERSAVHAYMAEKRNHCA